MVVGCVVVVLLGKLYCEIAACPVYIVDEALTCRLYEGFGIDSADKNEGDLDLPVHCEVTLGNTPSLFP